MTHYVLFAAGALVSLVAAIANKALAEIAWHELEEYCRRQQSDETFDDIHDRSETAASAIESVQIIGAVAALFALALAGWRVGPELLAEPFTLTVFVGVTAIAMMAWTVWIPREVARCWGAPFLARTWPLWRVADQIFSPVAAITSLLRAVTRRLDGRQEEWSEEEALEDEILSIVTEGQHDGLLEDDVREMIAGVIELDDTDVADIMTPRSDMDAISVDLSWSEMLEFVVRVGRTRIPVYERTLDNIVGLLYVKDLLAELAKAPSAQPRDLRAILRDVKRVPRSTRLDELLQGFLNNRSHLAIVVDEFMHVVGLVTIEDILEEIVGEIVDESDREEIGDVRWISDEVAEIQGRAHVEELNETLGIELPLSPEYDTVGGFLMHHLGRIPQAGESVTWHDVTLTVHAATKRRIELVRLNRMSNRAVEQ